MKELEVFFEGRGERWKLGTLADDGTDVLFEFSQTALERKLELSPIRLPLRAAAYPDSQDQYVHLMRLPGLLYDSLPDGWGLRLMDRKLRSRGIDPATLTGLDRLAYLGAHTLSALTFSPCSNEIPTGQDMALLELAEEMQALITDDSHEVLDSLAYAAGAASGARPKSLVFYNPNTRRMSTGESAVPDAEPWLAKFPAETDEADSCALEELYARLARKIMPDMAPTQFFQLSKKLTAFATRRFDREKGQRIHIHSLAGLLHLNFRIPSIGYGEFLRVTRQLTRDVREVKKALQRCAFNVLMHNRDDHSKNLSFLLDGNNEWKLAPPFDLTYCTGYNGEHFMDVAGEGRHPGRDHVIAVGHEGGLSAVESNHLLTELLDTLTPDVFQAAAAELPIRKTTVTRVAKVIAANRARLGLCSCKN